MKFTYHRKVIVLILIFSVLRIFTASIIELGNDETYYWVYSQQLQWNYFDHPPLVALWVRIFTLNGWLDHLEGFVRAGSVIGCAFSTWFIYQTVIIIKDHHAGWIAACLFNASLYAGMIAGILIMPDSPQLFFWTFCMWQIAKITMESKSWKHWILFGLSAGLCIMSKVHGVFILTGFMLFILIYRREWLRRPQAYCSFLAALIVSSPILLWNIKYDFITWRFHSARVDINQQDVVGDGFWIETIQQVLINNPVNIVLIVAALIYYFKAKFIHPALVAFNFIALPLSFLLLFISAFRDIWYHWSGPAYTTLLALVSVWLSEINKGERLPRAVKWSLSFYLLSLVVWPAATYFYPGTWGSQHGRTLGKGDITLDKYGWKNAGEHFAAFYEREKANDPTSREPIIAPSWWGAHVEYYFARPANTEVIGLGDTTGLRQYMWLNEQRMKNTNMDTAYCIVASTEDTASAAHYKNYYEKNEWIRTIPVYRAGKKVANFYIHRLTGWKGDQEKMLITGNILAPSYKGRK
jgi:hypothetical protein